MHHRSGVLVTLTLALLGAACAKSSSPATTDTSPETTGEAGGGGGEEDLCPLADWRNEVKDFGTSTIYLTGIDDGSGRKIEAREEGMGNFTGTATYADRVLRIDWQTADGAAGYYEWTLDDACEQGTGTVTFTAGAEGSIESTIVRVGP